MLRTGTYDYNPNQGRRAILSDPRGYKGSESAKLFLRAIEIEPDNYYCPLHLQNVYGALGRSEEAHKYARIGIEKAELALTLHPESSRPAQLGAAALAALGEVDRAKDWVARALIIDPDDGNVQYNAACTYALLGDADRAIDILEKWLPRVGPDPKRWFKNDTDLASIRNHPRYPKLLELAG